jgi:hypothetical protein
LYREIFLKYFTEGIFPNPSTNFQIMENSTNGAIVKAGFALVRGVTAIMDEDSSILFEKADSLDRIDRVVLRHDDTLSVRNTSIVILKGTPATTPQPPEITRDSTIWDLVLANVRIRANTNVVTQSQIEDTRLDTSICGIIASTIDTIDTETLYTQIQSDLILFKENEQADFLEWFNEIKDQLSEDQAGNLQNQIDEIKEQGVMVADTLPIGSVIHWDSEEPYPSDIYEEVTYNPRQLLVNPDFQINQRGKKGYGTTGYSCDMWYLYLYGSGSLGSFSLQDDDYWKLNNTDYTFASINQKISDDYRGKTVTFVGKFKNATGKCEMLIKEASTIGGRETGYMYGQTTITDNGIYYTTVEIPKETTYPCLVVSIYTEESIEIEYVDLFEGNIAYPHQKEDNDISNDRCYPYIFGYNENETKEILIWCTFGRINSDYDSIIVYLFLPKPMKSKPTVTYDTKKLANQHDGQTFTDFSLVLVQHTKNSVRLQFKKDNGTFPSTIKDPYVIFKNLILSCEPL